MLPVRVNAVSSSPCGLPDASGFLNRFLSSDACSEPLARGYVANVAQALDEIMARSAGLGRGESARKHKKRSRHATSDGSLEDIGVRSKRRKKRHPADPGDGDLRDETASKTLLETSCMVEASRASKKKRRKELARDGHHRRTHVYDEVFNRANLVAEGDSPSRKKRRKDSMGDDHEHQEESRVNSVASAMNNVAVVASSSKEKHRKGHDDQTQDDHEMEDSLAEEVSASRSSKKRHRKDMAATDGSGQEQVYHEVENRRHDVAGETRSSKKKHEDLGQEQAQYLKVETKTSNPEAETSASRSIKKKHKKGTAWDGHDQEVLHFDVETTKKHKMNKASASPPNRKHRRKVHAKDGGDAAN